MPLPHCETCEETKIAHGLTWLSQSWLSFTSLLLQLTGELELKVHDTVRVCMGARGVPMDYIVKVALVPGR